MIKHQAEPEGSILKPELGNKICADDRRHIIHVNNSNDALRTSAHPMISASYRVGLMLTTEVMIADAPSDDKHSHGMGDMGGMGGMM